MKSTRLFLLFFFAAQLAWASSPDGRITEAERDWLLDYQQVTTTFLEHMLQDVDQRAWDYRPAPERWTIAECAEHILVTEQTLLTQIRETSEKGESRPEQRSAIPDHETIVNLVTDRISKRATTAEAFEPSGKWATKDQFLQAFTEHRQKMAAYFKTMQAPLHHYFAKSPFGEIDLFQLCAVALAHTTRHTLQIEEIKAGLGLQTTALRLEKGNKITLDNNSLDAWQRLFADVFHQTVEETDNTLKVHMVGGGRLTMRPTRKGADKVNHNTITITAPLHQYDSVKRRLIAFGMHADGQVYAMEGMPNIKLLPRNGQ